VGKKSLPDDVPAALPYKFTRFDPPKELGDVFAEARAREEAGYQKGLNAGHEEGLKRGEMEMREKISGLDAILGELRQFRKARLEELLPEFLGLAEEIARKVIFREIKIDGTVVMDVAADALKRVSERAEQVIIKVNPADYETMITNLDILKEGTSIGSISVESQASISPGGCYIETRLGEVDARIEEKIKEVENAIATAAHSEM
jgi:flagellar assembly protein FliH